MRPDLARRCGALLGGAALLAAAPAVAVDHNNLDAGRPLRFEDAESIAFHEFALEAGLALSRPRRRPLGLGLDAEALYGFAPNSHAILGFEPSIGGRAGAAGTRFDPGDVALGLLHNFNREYDGTPALSLRGDLFLPTGRDSRGVAVRLRGIASRTVRGYHRLHLNLDLNARPRAGRREREFEPGLLLGYSRPLGYPRRFDRTGAALLAVQAGPRRGAGPIVTLGVGLRQQVTVRSVLDIGIESDVAAFGGAPRDTFRFVIGYSAGFPTR